MAAQVTCTECIANGTWKDLSRKDCKICGPDKDMSWSAADGCNPLNEFVKWILYSFDKSYTTYAFAHYGTVFCRNVFNVFLSGGRYDMVLTLHEM